MIPAVKLNKSSALLLLVFFAAAALSVAAFRDGWALAVGQYSDYLVSESEEKAHVPSIDRSLEFSAHGALCPDRRSRYSQYLMRTGGADQAIDQLDSVLRDRPTWPYDWLALALAYDRTGDSVSNLLDLALVYGPSERQLHIAIAMDGLRSWYELTPSRKDRVRESVNKLSNLDHRLLFKSVSNEQLVYRFCRIAVGNHRINIWCKRTKR